MVQIESRALKEEYYSRFPLADFVKKGIVKKTPQGYHIENKNRLKEIAEV